MKREKKKSNNNQKVRFLSYRMDKDPILKPFDSGHIRGLGGCFYLEIHVLQLYGECLIEFSMESII